MSIRLSQCIPKTVWKPLIAWQTRSNLFEAAKNGSSLFNEWRDRPTTRRYSIASINYRPPPRLRHREMGTLIYTDKRLKQNPSARRTCFQRWRMFLAMISSLEWRVLNLPSQDLLCIQHWCMPCDLVDMTWYPRSTQHMIWNPSLSGRGLLWYSAAAWHLLCFECRFSSENKTLDPSIRRDSFRRRQFDGFDDARRVIISWHHSILLLKMKM